LKPVGITKLHWLDRAVNIYNYHIEMCKQEKNWTIEKTANSLNRSVGSVSQDITVASWVKTHEKQLRRFRSLTDAMEFIKDKKREMKFREIQLDQ
jgi:hypothetical protein